MTFRFKTALPFPAMLMALLSIQTAVVQTATAQTDSVTASERAAVVERIAELVIEHYVYPDVALETATHLGQELANGSFDEATDPAVFIAELTASVQQINRDKHMRVRERAPVEATEDAEARRIRQRARDKSRKYGFSEVVVLERNIGFLDMRYFSSSTEARAEGARAMATLAGVDALIVDMRRNTGGSPGMVQFMCSYFFSERTHLNSLYWRQGDRTQEFWTLTVVPGEKLPDVPLFVLTSSRTFSGAEEFTYNLKTRERALIIGETTGGGANPGGTFPINDRFSIFIPTGRAINPVTGINWEGTGVTPDVTVSSNTALDVALEYAQEAAEAFRASQNR